MSGRDEAEPKVPPAMTFDEASAWHREELRKLSIEERVRWLGKMLEVMDLAHEARMQREAEAAGHRSTD